MRVKLKGLYVITFILFVAVSLFSCSENEGEKETTDLSKVPQSEPKLLSKFDQFGEFYFSYLGITSEATENGGFIVVSWDPAHILKLDQEGAIQNKTKQGRGPGEFIDVGVPGFGVDHIATFDQMQDKIVILNYDLKLVDELIIDPIKGYRIYKAEPLSDTKLFIELMVSDFTKLGEEPLKMYAIYNTETEEFENKMITNSRKWAPIGDVLNSRSGSFIQVPYSVNQLSAVDAASETVLMFDTRTDIIAELNSNLDTIGTIKVNIPAEKLSTLDKDSMKADERYTEDWEYLEPYLPEEKAVAENMLVFRDQIWLQTNIKGDKVKWLVLNERGEIIMQVDLPDKSMLTHISEYHLGVRLNDTEFALFEPVE